jgi:GntR family transcriptional regulator
MKLTFTNLVLSDQAPIYAQIVRRFKLMLAQGTLKDGDEAPSRRALALQLGVNPNTVQRAFAELEQLGVIETPVSARSVVRLPAEVRQHIRDELLTEQARELIDLSLQLEIPLEALVEKIRAGWALRPGLGDRSGGGGT